MVKAIADNIRQPALPPGVKLQRSVETIYFGGGTPGILPTADLATLKNALEKKFSIAADAEITLEANPEGMTLKKMREWRALGFNRLSIGVQSFRDEDLQWMNRSHNAEMALQCMHDARAAGFDNFSIDLIYGVPGMSDEAWRQNLQQALQLKPPHISAYALTVEEKTALHHFVEKGTMRAPDEERQAAHFAILVDTLTAAGYEHYEISNFALPGYRSSHNQEYWTGTAYYGFGPSAHSFDGDNTRWWYAANNALFMSHAKKGDNIMQYEVLTQAERLNEKIMTGLRRSEGIDFDPQKRTIATTMLDEIAWLRLQKVVDRHINNGMIMAAEERLVVTPQGRFLADGIASDLFL